MNSVTACVASAASSYTIAGGEEGRERLRLVSRVLHDSTGAFLDRIGIARGHAVLDAGCGGGDVTREIARRVGVSGRVVDVDADAAKLDLARGEAGREGLRHVAYACRDACEPAMPGSFDVVYARFLLEHLAAPEKALRAFRDQLRPGGVVAVEDIVPSDDGEDMRSDDAAVGRYRQLMHDALQRAGGSPGVGLRVPEMLRTLGFASIGIRVVQVLELEGEAKRLPAVTIHAMRHAIVRLGLATTDEVDALVEALEACASRPDTLLGTPRIVQVMGRLAG